MGNLRLPNQSEMERCIDLEFADKLQGGMPLHHFHRLSDLQWGYVDELADEAGLVRMPRVIQTMYRDARAIRKIALTTYKETNYSFTGANSFVSTFVSPSNNVNASLQ